MALESGTYIDDLVVSNPVGNTDPKSQGDDHLRLIKNVLKNTLPGAIGPLKFVSTDAGALSAPVVTLQRDSASPSASDLIGGLVLSGENDASEETIYASIVGQIDDVADGTEDGSLLLNTIVAGVVATAIAVGPTEVTFNRQVNFLQDVEFTGAVTTAGGDDFDHFPAGTTIPFRQTAAPTGWTKQTVDVNNRALRVVSGSVVDGGSTAFTSVFASRTPTGTVQGHTLTSSQMPSHTHAVSGTTGTISANHNHSFSDAFTTSANGAHNHNIPNGAQVKTASGGTGTASDFGTGATLVAVATHVNEGNHNHTGSVSGTTGLVSSNHTHSFSDTSSSTGGGASHSHGWTGNAMDFDVLYIDIIMATKD